MASSDSSFDVVSKVDMQEVKNAVDQALREVETRFDFKGSSSTIELDEKKNTIALASDNETRMKARCGCFAVQVPQAGFGHQSP